MPILHLFSDGDSRELAFTAGPSLRDILNTGDARIRSACRGNGACGLCRVRIEAGETPPINLAETLHLSPEQIEAGERLACQIHPNGDLGVTLLNPAPPSLWRSLADADYHSAFPPRPHIPGSLRFGVAVDLGTTHISLALCDLRNGRRLAMRYGPNPQAAQGSDILNRLAAAVESADTARALGAQAVAAIGEGLLDIASREGLSLHDVARVAVVGNTAMLTLLAGADPAPLLDPARWTAPFSCEPGDRAAWCVAWNLLPDTAIALVQPLAGFVGSDLAVGLLHARTNRLGGPCLFIDFGTNSEMALWTGQRFLATSAAGGPAFEGMGIRHGMAADSGAILHIRAAAGGWSLEVIGGGPPQGLCGPALVDLLALLRRSGELDETGRFSDGGGDYLIPDTAFRLSRRDVDMLQRAKAAIAAGFAFLLDQAGLAAGELVAVQVGGIFGRNLDPANAIAIGLLPAVAAAKIRLLGNTALDGCQDWVVSDEAHDALSGIRAQCRIVNLSRHEEFEELFLENLYLRPCTHDDTPMQAAAAPREQAFCFNAFIHAAQYLAGLLPDADLGREAVNVACRIFQADSAGLFSLGDDAAGLAYCSHPEVFAALAREMAAALAQVRENGFLAIEEFTLANGKPPLGGDAVFVFLPVNVHGRLAAVLAVGYTGREPPSRALLDALLGVAGLLGAAFAHGEATAILEHYREDLEEQVRQRTAELDDARLHAEAANRAKSAFLANMSHELRTPLNAILGFTQLMSRDANLDELQRHTLDIVNHSGKYLLGLINDILEISRIEAGRIELQPDDFDLRGMLGDIVDLIGARVREKGLELGVDLAPDLPRFIRGDEQRLRQVLMNLLGNAIKFTDRGRIGLGVEVRAGRLCFAVSDTGKGIEAAELARIFDPFYQTSAGYRQGEGTGMGLTISREYVRMMGGELTAESPPGEGARFRFDIPLVAAAGDALASATLKPVAGLAAGQPAWRVLVAEDVAESREFMQRLLAAVGFAVRTAGNGVEAIAEFRQWQPHLIWMDMRMPIMDGFEATRHIRALPGGHEVKIAALTAIAFAEDRQAILDAGCDAVVHKPAQENDIFQTMRQLLGLRFRHAEDKPAAMAPDEVDLSALPEDLRAELIEAAVRLDKECTLAIVERLRADHAVAADFIAGLVEDYRFDRLQALCERSRAVGQAGERNS